MPPGVAKDLWTALESAEVGSMFVVNWWDDIAYTTMGDCFIKRADEKWYIHYNRVDGNEMPIGTIVRDYCEDVWWIL